MIFRLLDRYHTLSNPGFLPAQIYLLPVLADVVGAVQALARGA